MTTHAPDLRHDPLAVRVRKKPLPVSVTFAADDGVCPTLEGPVAYQRGDALVTGVAGETWPIRRARFLERYAALPPTVAGTAGRYLQQAGPALARRMDMPFSVRVGAAGNVIDGRPGDWLLQYAPGEHGIVRADIFAASYELVG